MQFHTGMCKCDRRAGRRTSALCRKIAS